MAKSRDSRRRRRRRRGRGGGARVVLTFLSLVVIVAAVVAALTIFFKITAITVTGESRYTDAELIASSGIETGKNMFLFNKFTAYSRLFSAHPYLDEVIIRRRLPDTVEIIVTACQPVALLDAETLIDTGDKEIGQVAGRGYYLIDIKGKLLEKVDSPQGLSLPLVRGTSLLNPEVGKYANFLDEQNQKPLFLVLNTLLGHDILPNIGFIDVTEAYNISFQYLGRFVIRLGTTEQLDYKLRCVDSIITEHLTERDTGTIDVSSPETAAHFIPGAAQ